jgi:hypothetical protein
VALPLLKLVTFASDFAARALTKLEAVRPV